jgi:hypothetical protein
MVMWFVIFLAALLVMILVAVSQAPPGAERERPRDRPKAARPATARPRQTRAPGVPLSPGVPLGTGHAMPQAAAVPPLPAVRGGPMFQSALPAAEPSAGGLLNPAASPGYGPPFPPAPPPTSVLDPGAAGPGSAAGPGPGYVARHHFLSAGTYAPSPGGLSVTPPPVAGRPPWETAPQPPATG